jgi:hypothetical protein
MTTSLLVATRIKFGVLDDDGTYRLVHSADGQTVFPEPGAAIQEPDHVMRVCIDGLKQCAAAIRLAPEGRRATFFERTGAGWSVLADVVAMRWDYELTAAANGWTQRLDGQKVVDLAEGECDGPAVMERRRRPAGIYCGRHKSVRCQGPAMGSDGRTPARQDDQRGSARSGALKEILATLSAGAPDASRVERERHVKLLDGNT